MNYFSNINDLYKEILSGKQSIFGIFSDNISSKNEKEVFSTEEFEKTCKELNVVKGNLYSDYYLTIKDSYFHFRNVKNMYIEIDGLQYQIDYNKKCIVLYNKGYIHINSLEELKKIVNEYLKSYKIMEETLKKLEILGDFNE